MSASHRPSQSDPLAQEVNQLLAKLEHSGPRRASRPVVPGEAAAPIPIAARRAPVIASADAPGPWPAVALWSRLVLAMTAGGAMLLWPYAHRCDWPLLGYLGAVFAVLVSGAWVALAAWRARNLAVHVLALVLFFWGVVLAAEQILPRIGYAAVRASWLCRP